MYMVLICQLFIIVKQIKRYGCKKNKKNNIKLNCIVKVNKSKENNISNA